MGFILLLFFSLLSPMSEALTVQVENLEGDVLFEKEIILELPMHVGDISIQTFEKFEVPYDGSILGISEIFEIGQELDIISNSEMKAYGWCFSVDGVSPETLTHETVIEDQESTLKWYYAYAHYVSGEWVGQCLTQD
ncbi:MAG: hypothetical protein HRT44_02960 [Bdellovibrionales bacterium]|nr:hypothetical protein [Bdellovibrionales bacterium]NQZ18206.1 hypothetical protein [Bdellovibrionales bacterium]